MDIKLKHPILTSTLVAAVAIIVVPFFFKSLSGHSISSWLETPTIPAKPELPIIQSNLMVFPEKSQPSAWTNQAVVNVSYPQASDKNAVTLANTGWSIDMGSFSNATAAIALQHKLQSHGYVAYLQKTSKSTQVLVGPEVKREKAEALLAQINHDLNLKGNLISYDPLHLLHSKAG